MKRIQILLLVIVTSIAVSAQAVQFFQGTLNGAQQSAPNNSRGTGRIVLVLNDAGDTMFYRLSVSGLTGINGAHIHEGAPGVDGQVIFPFDQTGLVTDGTINGSFSVTPAQGTTFQNGGFYANVHTTTFPGGEIRGQIAQFTPPGAFTAILTGDQETPPVTTSATGVGRFTLAGSTLNYQVSVAHISNITASHIHRGAVGVEGPAVFPLFPSGSNPTFDTTTPINGSVLLAPADLVDVLAKFFYVNVHTQANGNGEIRGQILQQKPMVFTANLDGAQETPPVTTNATGKMWLVLDAAMTTIYYRLEVSNVSNVTAQHIHEGAPGVPGGVIFPLSGTLAPGSPISGSIVLAPADVAKFIAGDYYANVHTVANGGGEIRGQIGRFTPPARFSALMLATSEHPAINNGANGIVRFTLSDNSILTYTILVERMSSAIIAAHIHLGGPTADGGVLVGLYATGTFDEANPFSATTAIPPQDLVDFLAGNTYANVHTANNGNGEIRGQIRPQVAGDANGDSTTTVADVFYLINNLFAGGPLPDGGDANGDQTTTVADVFYLINNLFAGGPAPQ